jgi:hypothetical protein
MIAQEVPDVRQIFHAASPQRLIELVVIWVFKHGWCPNPPFIGRELKLQKEFAVWTGNFLRMKDFFFV